MATSVSSLAIQYIRDCREPFCVLYQHMKANPGSNIDIDSVVEQFFSKLVDWFLHSDYEIGMNNDIQYQFLDLLCELWDSPNPNALKNRCAKAAFVCQKVVFSYSEELFPWNLSRSYAVYNRFRKKYQSIIYCMYMKEQPCPVIYGAKRESYGSEAYGIFPAFKYHDESGLKVLPMCFPDQSQATKSQATINLEEWGNGMVVSFVWGAKPEDVKKTWQSLNKAEAKYVTSTDEYLYHVCFGKQMEWQESVYRSCLQEMDNDQLVDDDFNQDETLLQQIENVCQEINKQQRPCSFLVRLLDMEYKDCSCEEQKVYDQLVTILKSMKPKQRRLCLSQIVERILTLLPNLHQPVWSMQPVKDFVILNSSYT